MYVTLKARPETPEEMQEPVGDAPRSPGAERRTAATKLAAAHKGLVHSTDSSVQVASFFDRSCPLLLCLLQLSLKCGRQRVRYAARLAVE